MELKRHFTTPPGWERHCNVPDAAGRLPNPHRAPGTVLNLPPLSHVEIRHTGTSCEQHFSTRLVERGMAEGWIAIQDGHLILYAQPENLIYDIVRTPGRYSCFDGRKLPDDPGDTGALARALLAEQHTGQPSPDPNHPAGYEKINYYDCVLPAAQHAKFCQSAQGGSHG